MAATPARCPNKRPGRFEGEAHPCLTEALDALASLDMADETVGSVLEQGHAALFRFSDPLPSARESGHGVDLCPACERAANGPAGAVLFTDTVGFVSAYLAPTAADLEASWAGYVADLTADDQEA